MCVGVLYVYALKMGYSENFAITLVKIVIFTIMNSIKIVDLLNISIHNTMDFSSTMKYHSFRSHFTSFQEIFVDKLAHISYKFM